jgi:hypothetical protein
MTSPTLKHPPLTPLPPVQNAAPSNDPEIVIVVPDIEPAALLLEYGFSG